MGGKERGSCCDGTTRKRLEYTLLLDSTFLFVAMWIAVVAATSLVDVVNVG